MRSSCFSLFESSARESKRHLLSTVVRPRNPRTPEDDFEHRKAPSLRSRDAGSPQAHRTTDDAMEPSTPESQQDRLCKRLSSWQNWRGAPPRVRCSHVMRRPIKRLRPDVQHFFDTNFFVLQSDVLPALKHVPMQRRWVTETVSREVNDKLGESAAQQALAQHHVLSFDDLYREDANVCRTFYAYVESIYSPANVGSADFYAEMMLSRRIKGIANEQDNRTYEELRRMAAAGRATLPGGLAKPPGLRKLERYDAKTRKKIVHPANRSVLLLVPE